jgi:hypothetical protein
VLPAVVIGPDRRGINDLLLGTVVVNRALITFHFPTWGVVIHHAWVTNGIRFVGLPAGSG